MSALLQGSGNPVAVTDGTGVPDHFHNGIPREADGTIAADSSGAIDHYHQGLPMTVEGRLCSLDGPLDHFGSGAAPFDSGNRLFFFNTNAPLVTRAFSKGFSLGFS